MLERNIYGLFFFFFVVSERCTSTIITTWRQRVTVVCYSVVRGVSATTRHITRRHITLTQRPPPTRIGRRRRHRNPSWTLPRHPHIPTVRTHPFPVSIGPESKTAAARPSVSATITINTSLRFLQRNKKKERDKSDCVH